MATGYETPKTHPVDAYNAEAQQVYLKALRGNEGKYQRYESGTNIVDLLSKPMNDN